MLPRQRDPVPTIGVRRPGRALLARSWAAASRGTSRSATCSRRLWPTSWRTAEQPDRLGRRVPRRAWRTAARTCPYFGFCGGAHASNRYFEQGRFDVTETEHCRNTKIRLMEGVLDHAQALAPRA